MIEDVGLWWFGRDENEACIYLNLVESGFNFGAVLFKGRLMRL